MKKNVMMRLACFLLVAVLISTSAISGTYAKYVTAETSVGNARVAKFGVEITLNDETMFSDSYKHEKTEYTAGEELATITVQADTEDTNVVAPGTKGALVGFNITGTPEVDVEITYAPTLTLSGWEVDGTFYCPIVFTVNGTKIDGLGYTSADALASAVQAAIQASTAIYHTNTDLSTVVADDLAVSWEWPFSTSTDNDVKDTALGDAAAEGNAATIKLDLTCTVTQID